MQTVSNEFKQMCKSNTPSGAIGRIKVIEDDITIAENTDIQDITIEDNCYVNDKFVGTTVAKKVTVNLFNDDNIYDLENKEIEVKLGFQHYEEEQTYKGKNIQIFDAKPIKPEIQLYGETNQEGTPALDSPIDIENLKTKNKFNYEKAKDYRNTIISTYRLFEISGLEPNTKYTFSGIDIASTTTAYIYLWNSTDYNTSTKAFISSPTSFNTAKAITLTSGTNGCIYLAMHNVLESTWDEFITRFEKAQLEIGITNTPYVPYNSTETRVSNKNKIDITKVEEGRFDDGVVGYAVNTTDLTINNDSFSFTTNAKYRGVVSGAIPVVEGQSIYYSQNEEFTSDIGVQVSFYNNKGQFISKETFWYKPIVVPEGTAFLKLWWAKTEIGTQTITKPQLEIGEVATEYERHISNTAYFPLAEGQKLYEGSYLADDGVHNVRGQTTLSEISKLTTDTLFGTQCQSAGFVLPNAKSVGRNYNFVSDKIAPANEAFGQYKAYRNLHYFIVMTTIDDTLENFNSKIAGSIVEYELAEEEIVPYTEEQKKAYNQLQNLMLFNGTNHISSNANLIVTLGKELTSFGNFIIEKPVTEEVQAKTNFIGYDYMIKFNKLYVDNITYPISLAEYFSELCNQVGVEVGNIDFVNANYMVQGNAFTNNEDCRTVLSAIAQIAGGIAKIGRDNKVYIISLGSGSVIEEIDGNNYDTFTPNKSFGPINKVVLRMNNGVDGEESVRIDEENLSQNEECAILIADNPILNSHEQRELVIDNIFNTLKGITYLPYKTTYYGYPYLDSTDKIKILNINDTEYNSYVFNHTIKYDGTFSGSIETSALTKTQSMYKNTVDLKTWRRNTELKVDKINGKISSIIEQQEGTQKQINSIIQDATSTTQKIEDIENETNSKIEELKVSIDGITNQWTQTGGNNVFYYDTEYWINDNEDEKINIEEYTSTEIKSNSFSGRGYIINSGSSYQNAEVKNGTYTVSFKYKKTGPELSNVSVKINDKEYPLTKTNWEEFVQTIDVNSNYIKVEFISDTDNTLYVVDLLGNLGTEKDVWTQNPNEIRTDTVKIGKGIQVDSSETNTYHRIDADGNRTYNRATGKVVNEATDKGTVTEELVVRGQTQMSGILIKQQGNQTWISSLL